MKTYLVPFQEEETVWVNYLASVNANSKEEAYDKLKGLIEAGETPHHYDDEVDGHTYLIEATQNLGIAEHIGGDGKFNIEDFGIDDVKEIDERVSCKLDFTAFDIARYGQDELYNIAEAEFSKVGLSLEILEMDMIPTKIEEHFVSYDCIPTEYVVTFTDGDMAHMKNGIKQ